MRSAEQDADDARRTPRSPLGGTSPGSRDAESLLELRQKERSRIAFDLHDGPAQAMATALLQVRLLKIAEPDELQEGLEELEGQLLSALDQLYGAMEQLRSKALDHSQLVPKLETLTTEFSSRTGIPASFSAEAADIDLSDSLQIAVFQIVHEALQNIASHADATTVAVAVRITEEEVSCSITDDGHGFDPAGEGYEDAKQAGYGLTGMQERARLLNGECRISSLPGAGCRVEVGIPIWRG